MRAATLTTAALLALTSHVSAETIRIDVGENGFTFTPDSVKAKVDDVLEFHFHPLNHSVVMGDFKNPCAPAKTGGFFSGFMPVSSGEANDVFQVTVNSTDPIFFYCSQNTLSHCINGMSGVVNGNSSQTLAAYQKAAKSATSASNPDAPLGGRLVASSDATSTSAAPASTTSCTTTSNSGNGNGYKRSNTCSGAGSVQASVGIVAAFTLGMAILLY
ncbi:hypothetical protein TARUN_7881 [Trichoderma arundinaceum]|uniref:Extracellular serine-rich n=1 Tax=Trichoderma arundinaceum TaxID=490622 RepID=A0A395NE21_TRIAR|nr:hypothetical protein TARUN_7881 [Trichoderma arundinaceum]